ncbi:MAG: Spy0128 family protein [Eggerthellaceae bacterium]
MVAIGDVLEYTVYWENTEDAEDGATVTIKDTVPTGTKFVSAANDGTEADGTVTWKFHADKGAKGFVTFKVEVTKAALDIEADEDTAENTIENTATVQLNNGPEVKTNEVTNPVPEKDVSSTTGEGDDATTIEDADGKLVGVGDTLTYTVKWANLTGEEADVTVTDAVPAGTEYVDGSAAIVDPDNALENKSAGMNDGKVTWTFTAPAGASGTVTFKVKVTEAALDLPAKKVENTAKVKIGDDPAVDTNTTTNPVPEKDVADVTKNITDADGNQVAVGDELTYTVHWQNTEADEADVTITDKVPAGTAWKSTENATATKGEVTDATNSKADDGTITWKFKAGAGAEGIVTFHVTVTEDALHLDPDTNTVENQATVKIGDKPAVKTNTTENPVPEKTVENTTKQIEDADGKQASVGDELLYTVTWKNTKDKAANVKVTDEVPEGTVYVDQTAKAYDSEGHELTGIDAYNDNGTVTWVLSNRAAGASGTVTFKVKVTKAALDIEADEDTAENTVENTAKVKLGDDPAIETNEVTNPVPEKDVSSTSGEGESATTIEDADGKTVNIGDTLTYTVKWYNGAVDDKGNPVDADVTVTDTVPDGTEYVDGSAAIVDPDNALENKSASEADGTVTWKFHAAAGAKGTVTFKVKVDESVMKLDKRQVDNTATVTIGDDSADTNTTHNNVPGKSVDRTPASDPQTTIEAANGKLVGVGDVLTYKVSWTNTESDKADVVITDDVPQGTELVAGSISDGGKEANGTITWTLKDQASGASGTVTFQVKVTEAALELAGNTVENQATVTIGDNPGVKTNKVTNPVPEKDVSTLKDDGTTVAIEDADGKQVSVGGELLYTVHWQNTEGKEADVTVTDEVPDGTEYVDGSAAIVDPDNALENKSAGMNDGKVTWTFTAPAGAEGTVTFKVKVTEAAFDLTPDDNTVENTATVKIGDNPECSTNTVTNPVPEKTVENVTKQIQTADGKQASVGDELLYTVKYTNGHASKADVTITDKVPAGTEYVAGSADHDGTESGGTVKWTIKDVPAGASGTVSFKVKVTKDVFSLEPTDDNTVRNTATVQIGDDPAVDTNEVTNPVPEKDVKNETKNIEHANGKPANVGDTLTYSITWRNGTGDKAKVSITDAVPAGTEYVDGSASNGGTLDTNDNTVKWDLGEQGANASGTVTFQVKITKAVLDLPATVVNNTAKVKIGDDPAVDTNKVTNPVDEKTVANEAGQDMDGGTVTVGDVLTYTVHYTNGENNASDVIVTDTIPTGTEYVKDSADHNGSYDATANKLTWTIKDVPAGNSGTVSFKVKVTKAAVKQGTVKNKATIQIGENGPKIDTNEVTTNVESGGLVISKKVKKSSDNMTPNKDAEFTFTVNFKKADGSAVEGDYDFTGTVDGTEAYTGTVNDGGTITLKAGGSVTITGLPNGTKWTVTESSDSLTNGFTNDSTTQTGTIEAKQTTVDTAAFTNTYSAKGDASIQLKKKLNGRDWKNFDEFEFTIKATGDNAAETPMPAEKTVKVTSSTAKDGDEVPIDFGNITYKKPGTYTYEVTEKVPTGNKHGIEYDTYTAKVTVTVTDNGNGTLTATPAYENDTFTNTYAPGSVKYNSAIEIVKEMTGKDIKANDFKFDLKGKDAASTAKLKDGKDQQYATTGATMNGKYVATETLTPNTGLEFTGKDAGKTFSYTLTEDKGGTTADGITYDGATHTLDFTVSEDEQTGVLSVKVSKDGEYAFTMRSDDETTHDPVSFTFKNSYKAEPTQATINAKKTLTGRDLVQNEFNFKVTEKNAAGNTKVVAQASNAADGTIDFGAINYTLDQLRSDNANGYNQKSTGNDGSIVYTYNYTVSEDQPNPANGITQEVSSFNVVVAVTDNGKGQLSTAVTYPDGTQGSTLEFKNSYNTNEVDVQLNGSKRLTADEGLNPPDINGKFTFTVTGSEGAPMPQQTTVTNDNGTVDFGNIHYTMANVFGSSHADNPSGKTRTKTFTYTITEQGTVNGVTNDSAKTVKVKVTDNGDGTMVAQKMTADEEAFTFTNHYEATPVKGHIEATKSLNGRDMKKGEFDFILTDENGETVASGTNDADGKVVMSNIEFTKPGTYKYTLSEVEGNSAGVEYDPTTYAVTATVTDEGTGALKLTWTISDEYGNEVDEPAFMNSYLPTATSVTFGATKVMKNGQLKGNDFTFNLKDSNGTVLQTKANAADGKVTFDSISYDQAGTYRYTISEVLPSDDNANLKGIQKNGVTYDKTVHTVTVKVTDSGEGYLTAAVTYDDSIQSPTFTNVQIPNKDVQSEKEKNSNSNPSSTSDNGSNGSSVDEVTGVAIVQTGDATPFAVIAIIALGAGATALVLRKRKDA